MIFSNSSLVIIQLKSISSANESTAICASLFTVKFFLAFIIGSISLIFTFLFFVKSILFSLLNFSQQYLKIASSKSLPPKNGRHKVSKTLNKL